MAAINFGGGIHVREFVLLVETHRHAQVILAEKENVDTRHSSNLVDVFDAICCFNLKRDNRVAAGGAFAYPCSKPALFMLRCGK